MMTTRREAITLYAREYCNRRKTARLGVNGSQLGMRRLASQ
jgi:hypothetical protein